MVDILYLGCAVCTKPCNNKGSACTKVGSLNGSARKPFNALNYRYITVNGDICAHSAKLVHVTEAVVENALVNNACTVGEG